MQKPDELMFPFGTTIKLNNDLSASKFVIIMIGISLFLYTITYITQLSNGFIPNKRMFMNMLTDNYEKSIYDFNDYVNKIIDDNYKIQSLLGNTKIPVNSIPAAQSTSTSTTPAPEPTTTSAAATTTNSNTSSSSGGLFSLFNTDSTSTSTLNTVNSIFSTPTAEGFTNNTPVIDGIQKIKEWIMIHIKKFLSNFYIKRNTIYIRR
jgi:hypothetical protein